MVRPSSEQSLTKTLSPFSKKKRKNYHFGDVDKAITNIETGELSHAKAASQIRDSVPNLGKKM